MVKKRSDELDRWIVQGTFGVCRDTRVKVNMDK